MIPSKASAKISMRLVPNQDYRKISKLFEKYFKSIAPKSVKVTVKSLHGGMPYVAPTDMPAYKAVSYTHLDVYKRQDLATCAKVGQSLTSSSVMPWMAVASSGMCISGLSLRVLTISSPSGMILSLIHISMTFNSHYTV